MTSAYLGSTWWPVRASAACYARCRRGAFYDDGVASYSQLERCCPSKQSVVGLWLLSSGSRCYCAILKCAIAIDPRLLVHCFVECRSAALKQYGCIVADRRTMSWNSGAGLPSYLEQCGNAHGAEQGKVPSMLRVRLSPECFRYPACD